jgi:cytochrome c-type biogenesis protein CcmE
VALTLRKVGYLTASKIMSDLQARPGQNVNVVGVVEYESLEVTPDMKVFELTDENNENLKVRVEYTGSLPSNLAKGKKASISGNYDFWIYV